MCFGCVFSWCLGQSEFECRFANLSWPASHGLEAFTPALNARKHRQAPVKKSSPKDRQFEIDNSGQGIDATIGQFTPLLLDFCISQTINTKSPGKTLLFAVHEQQSSIATRLGVHEGRGVSLQRTSCSNIVSGRQLARQAPGVGQLHRRSWHRGVSGPVIGQL